jgi:ribosome-associated protein
MLRVTDSITLGDREVDERFVRAMGPAGQNARNDETAVELRFDIGASSLSPDVKERLTALAGRFVTTEGVLVVVSRVHRSQAENREAAHARFIALVQRAATPPKKRLPTRPRPAQRDARLLSKHQRGAVKQDRSQHADE